MLRTNQMINYNWEDDTFFLKKKKGQETGISFPNPPVFCYPVKGWLVFEELDKAANYHEIVYIPGTVLNILGSNNNLLVKWHF